MAKTAQCSWARYPAKLRLRTQEGLPRAIEIAAAARRMQPSEWARQALLSGLARDGLRLLPDGQVDSTPVLITPVSPLRF